MCVVGGGPVFDSFILITAISGQYSDPRKSLDFQFQFQSRHEGTNLPNSNFNSFSPVYQNKLRKNNLRNKRKNYTLLTI